MSALWSAPLSALLLAGGEVPAWQGVPADDAVAVGVNSPVADAGASDVEGQLADGAAPPTVPALTPVALEILEDLGSNVSVSDQTFALRLAEDVVVDDVTVIAAGTPGMGEVVHAKKSGGMGAAGELILAARFLDLDGRLIRLRSMRFAENGEDRIGTVNTINTAAAATLLPVGLVGFFMKGGRIDVPAGTIARAKLAVAFQPDAEAGADTPVSVAPNGS